MELPPSIRLCVLYYTSIQLRSSVTTADTSHEYPTPLGCLLQGCTAYTVADMLIPHEARIPKF